MTDNNTWQPGHTAPTDGRTIWGKWNNGEIELIRWSNTRHIGIPGVTKTIFELENGWVSAEPAHDGMAIDPPNEWKPI